MNQPEKKAEKRPCHHCEGKGYIELRDCAGEIQRTETCSYCEGKGYEVITDYMRSGVSFRTNY